MKKKTHFKLWKLPVPWFLDPKIYVYKVAKLKTSDTSTDPIVTCIMKLSISQVPCSRLSLDFPPEKKENEKANTGYRFLLISSASPVSSIQFHFSLVRRLRNISIVAKKTIYEY